MESFLKSLPVLALLMGITMAFATQNDTVAPTKKALNDAVQWIDITGQVEGVHYDCDEADRICTALFDEMGNQIPETEVEGRYKLRNP